MLLLWVRFPPCCWILGVLFFFFFFLSLSVLNKALKWEVDRMVFITVLTFILIHFRN